MIGTRLKELRILHNLTQKQMMKYLDTEFEESYRKYESNRVLPRMEKVIKLADHFNVSLDWLFQRTDNPNINK